MTTAPARTKTDTQLRTEVGEGRVGDSPPRPDSNLKALGEFAYGSDLWMDDMIWGVTLRSPHPYARIRSIDIGPALATPGAVSYTHLRAHETVLDLVCRL